MQARLYSSHCSGIGPDKLIFENFLQPAMRQLGFSQTCSAQHHFSMVGAFVNHANLKHLPNLRRASLTCTIQEIDNAAREVLIAGCSQDPDADEHVGADMIMGHFGLDATEVSSLSLLGKLTTFFTRPALPFIWCFRHNRYCHLSRCDLDCSGFPCTDYSPAGKKLGILGPTFPVLLSLLSWHRASRTRILFLENVPEFPLLILEALMGDLFTVHPFYLSPEDVACEFLSRKRVFLMLLLRGQGYRDAGIIAVYTDVMWLELWPRFAH